MSNLWKRLLSLVLTLSMLCGLAAVPPATASAAETGTAVNAVNGHRDVFSSTRVGQMPAGFETSGTWGIVQGTAIDNWNGIPTLQSNGSSYPYTVNESWSHFLRRESGSAFAVYESSYTDFDFTTHMMIPSGATTGAVVFHYTDENNYYYYKLTVGGGAALGKVVNGTDTVLKTNAGVSVAANTWYNLRVTMTGSQIVTKITTAPHYITLKATQPAQNGIAGTQTFSVADTALTSGKVGYWSEGEGSASAQYCVFAVSNTAADFTLENSTFKVTTGPYGQIKELYLKSDNNTNFVSNEETHREDVGENHFLGEIIFTYEVGGTRYTASTGASDDTRQITKVSDSEITVSYQTASQEAEGIRHFTVVETYTLENDHLQFDIEITNNGSEELTILDMGLPMMWNNHWQFQSPYTEYASATGYYVSYNGSWLQIESAGGGAEKKDGGQKLLFLPDNTTDAKLEYRRYYSNEQSFGMVPETFYVYSKAISAEGQGYLESTSKTLAAGGTDKLSFRLYATDSYLDTEETIYEAGSLDVQVNPGLVVPDDITALVDIHTSKTVESVELITVGKTATVTAPTSSSGDHKVYSIKFNKQGRNDVQITYDGGKKSVLQFWVTDSVNEAMQAHVDFLMNTLRITDPSDRHYGSFNEYNNVTGTVLTKVGDECSNNNYEQMYDGPAFIAEKQVYYPVQAEIDAMDVYLIDLVHAKELVLDESSEHYGRLYFGCEEPGFTSYGNPANVNYNGYTVTSRIFNYFRICNTFYSMYKASAYYGDSLSFRWEPTEYLYWAGMLAAWGEEISGTTGTMGEQTVPDIIEALKKEGLTDLAARLEEAARTKGNAVARQAFPFGSEFSVDRTGEEGAYFLSKLIGSEASQIKAINKIMAWISKTPTWYQQTTGRTNDTDWWIFQYTVSLQAAALKDWYFDHADAEAYWSMIYPSAFSSFIHIRTSQEQESNGPLGTVWWNYWPTRPYDWTGTANHSGGNWPNGQTGEADIDLWGGMQILSTDVVLNDPSFGLTAYGGTAVQEDGKIVVTPQDGLYTNLNVVGAGAKIELQSDKYSQAKLTVENNKLTAVSLSLDNFLNKAHEAELTISGLPAGAYQLTINGSRQMIINLSGSGTATFTYQVGEGDAELTIEPYAGHEGNLRVALIGDDTLAGKGTSDWTVKGAAGQLETQLEAQSYDVQTYINGDSEISTFDPDMVVLMTESASSASDYGALIETYQQLSLKPIVYAVTTGNAAVSESIRTAAGEKSAVLIDAWDLIEQQPDLVQDNALNNNGVRELVGLIYKTVSYQTYSAPAVTRAPYDGIEAVEFDRQSGAHYVDARESADSTNEPYVHIDADGYIGFEGLNLDKITTGITLTAGFDSDGILQVYTGNPNEGGRLVGQADVTSSASGAAAMASIMVAMSASDGIALYAADGSASSDLLELSGTTDIYLKPSVGMDVKTVTMGESSIPAYKHDFSYDDGRWEDWGQGAYYPSDTGTAPDQRVYWIDDNFLGLIKGLNIQNFRYEFDYELYDGEQTGGVVFRVTSHNSWNPTGIGVLFDAANNKLLVVTMPDKTVIQEFDHTVGVYDGTFDHMSILVYDNTIEIYGTDGALIGTVTDEKISNVAGQAGVWTEGESIDFTNINIRGLDGGAPIIMANPVDVTTNETKSAAFTVEARGYAASDTLAYQWQKSENEVIWEDIPGAAEASYTIDNLTLSNDGTYYRVIVTANGNSENSTASAAAKLTVLPLPVVESVTVTPSTASVRAGGSQLFAVEVTGQNDPDRTVTWTVTGGSDAGTYVREDGTLFVSENEPVGTTLTVTATSTYDASKSATAAVTVAAAVTKEDVVLHYIFDEGSGNTVFDYSANQYDGTISGNTTTAWSADGYAFDGRSSISPGTSAQTVSSNMTLVYKVKRTGAINGASSLFWGMPKAYWNGNGMWLNFDGGIPLGVDTDGANRYEVEGTTNEFYPMNQWVEVAVSVNAAGDLAIYRNGELVGSAAGHFITAPSEPYNTIGMAGYDNEYLHNMTMGEYIIFNKALSESEAKAVYEDKFKPDEPVGPQDPVYNSISIDPTTAAVRAGGTVSFTSMVSGRYLPEDGQAVTWELTGSNSQGTTLNNGVLDGRGGRDSLPPDSQGHIRKGSGPLR